MLGTSQIDEVDRILAKTEGKIERKRGRMCNHGANSKCTNCLPLDPYDEEYLKEKEIKHMSFHSHVRKLTDGHGKSTKMLKPLENDSYKLEPKCPNGHKPFPKGICTKCRPAVCTLMRQKFRHVDNITIENDYVVNRFLNYWRKSGHQRIGYLIGRYIKSDDVPLGIKAVVAAIYEPPQSSSADMVKFEEDPHSEAVDQICTFLDLKRVGWIFTDLWSKDASEGTVHCTRHKDSFLVSASECITAGSLQNKYKNYTTFCNDGYFGSKFVTVVASGDSSEHINFSGYQVSNQCSALVDADILCPTSHPELASVRTKPKSETHYITDVMYTEKNEYGGTVQRDGRPMPVEYLLVDVPAGMPKESFNTFHRPVEDQAEFPNENRATIGEDQDLKSISGYIKQFTTADFLAMATNFHFLLFLKNNNIVPFSNDEIRGLCECIRTQDAKAANEWRKNTGNWTTLMSLLDTIEMDAPTNNNAADGSGGASWACQHCTFENTSSSTDCSMCGLPCNG
ncbi:hypothetical protein L596_018051 [Steinernema carpocapsae]|uniref:MPN domain-containing protein n=1 Tax=Steinernema carpocapsae TaxID=34508 RepID=A0A4U5N3G9_STECR|nr:hypothetical protein L596_018051 [Steinernema carpocapsae]